MKVTLLLAVMAATALAAPATAAVQIEDLGSVAGCEAYADDVAPDGHTVVSFSNCASPAFGLAAPGLTASPTATGYGSAIDADHRVIGGDAVGSFLWQAGAVVALPPLPGKAYANPRDLAAGQPVVGSSWDACECANVATSWNAAGVPTSIGRPGDTSSAATGINAAGQISGHSRVGGNVFAWRREESGTYTVLAPIYASRRSQHSQGNAISSAGDVVGQSANKSGAVVPVLWDARTLVPRTLPSPRRSTFHGFDVNAQQVVVGQSSAVNPVALAWSPRRGLVDLNTLTADPGWRLTSAAAVSDSGVGVGGGLHNGVPAAFRLQLPSGF